MVMPEDGTISLGYTLIVVVINSRHIAMIKKQKKGRQSSVVRINGGAEVTPPPPSVPGINSGSYFSLAPSLKALPTFSPRTR